MTHRLFAILKIATLGLSLSLAGLALAQEKFPSRPVTIVVPQAAGGANDAIARVVAQKLSEQWGQTVLVENRPGAGGNVGTAFAAKAKNDGYTLLVNADSAQVINPALYAKTGFDPVKDFDPIAPLAKAGYVLVANPSMPANNVAELIALAKSKPGALSIASAGNGTLNHLIGEMLQKATDIQLQHIPYKGGAPAMQALLAGDVQMTSVSVNTSMVHIQSGKARAIGLAATKRSPALPDVPTFIESGIPFEAENWIAILGPAGIPAPIVNKLNAEIAASLQSPDVKERLAKLGLDVVASTPAAYSQLLVTDVPKWGKAVKDSGAVAE